MWKCPKCKEKCEDNFDSCWSCGTGRDGSPPAEPFPERETTVSESSSGRTQERARPRQKSNNDIWQVVILIANIVAVLAFGYAAYGAYQFLDAENIAKRQAQEAAGMFGAFLLPSMKDNLQKEGEKKLLIGGIAVVVALYARGHAQKNSFQTV